MLFRKLKFNIWDLNFVLLVVGFPFFTMLISDAVASVAFRGFTLLVSIICLYKTGVRIPKNKLIYIFLITLLVDSIQSNYGLFFGEYESSPFIDVKIQFLAFNVGVVWIPLLAFVSGFERINWRSSCLVTFCLLFYTIFVADLNTSSAEVSNDGRYNMGRISTLGFGDNGAYLVLLSVALIVCRKYWLYKYKKFWILALIAGIAVGVFGVAKAGSRGPFLGLVTGLIFLCICLKKRERAILASLVFLLGLFGIFSSPVIQSFAPALYNRMNLTIEEHDMGGRDVLFEEAIDKFIDHPILGSNPVEISANEFSGVHNVYLEVLIATGFILFVLFIGVVLFAVKGSIKKRWLLLRNPGYLFLALMFWFNCARGISGIQFATNAIYNMVFVGLLLILTYGTRLRRDRRIVLSHTPH